ncbi:MAG: hypothetical protein EBU84_14330 [Actinobacteria bacterium]|nr:hypothetical protein [Actinomycetota bacterium]
MLVAVEVPVFGHHDPFAAASDDRAPGMGRSSSWHCLYYCILHVMQLFKLFNSIQFLKKCGSQTSVKPKKIESLFEMLFYKPVFLNKCNPCLLRAAAAAAAFSKTKFSKTKTVTEMKSSASVWTMAATI